MKKINLLIIAVFCFTVCQCQNYFRSGIFLHHSTGQYIWGPNNDGTSTTTIPEQMHLFNVNHSLTGDDSITMNEEWWAPGDNEWSTQHLFFEGNLSESDLNNYLSAPENKIIVVKSCFPSSELAEWGQPLDSVTDPTYKTVYNYKWHWRSIIKVMENHPDHFFVIWTNAPLEVNSTNTTQADLALKFCTWAKDTLAEGLDTEFGTFPPNVYVFDYFRKIAGPDGIEPVMYATGPTDSHPNGAATDFIAPQFVDEVFNAAMAYESVYTILDHNKNGEISIFPNPVNDKLYISGLKNFSYEIFDSTGNLVKSGKNKSEIGISDVPKGIYFVKIISGTNEISRKLVIE
jgi:hypothetical protein